jgi:predicted ATPase with chaperone activity
MHDLANEDGVSSRHLPPMIAVGDGLAPRAPANFAETRVSPAVLSDLALKTAYTVPNFTTEWAARQLHLPQQLAGELLELLRTDRLLDVLGLAGPLGYRFAISQPGRERAARLLEISGYVGPAPVSLESYTALLESQLAQFPSVSSGEVSAALAELVLPEEAVLAASLAVSSGRSLFVFGPAGNGKTSLGRALHNAQQGDLWIPRCIGIDSSIIRVYDPQVHHAVEVAVEQPWMLDHRWVRIRRPLVVLGGETTLDSFDLTYSQVMRFYEAPLHVKANGGTLLIDDFGRQRVEPLQMLNRWIIPLEHQIDYLTLHTGQQIQVPFRQMLIIATNLNPEAVTDPAFLRRMGYRLRLDKPSAERYQQIFQKYASRRGVNPESALVARLIERYRAEDRELRCCEPRDLIERARDICRFQGQPFELNEQVLDLAWAGYFGAEQAAN